MASEAVSGVNNAGQMPGMPIVVMGESLAESARTVAGVKAHEICNGQSSDWSSEIRPKVP